MDLRNVECGRAIGAVADRASSREDHADADFAELKAKNDHGRCGSMN